MRVRNNITVPRRNKIEIQPIIHYFQQKELIIYGAKVLIMINIKRQGKHKGLCGIKIFKRCYHMEP